MSDINNMNYSLLYDSFIPLLITINLKKIELEGVN
jgi:hypothetical protein